MNCTSFPFFRGAFAMALALIAGASYMTGCMVETNLAGGDSTGGSTGGTGVGGMGGSGGGMGGSENLCFVDNTCDGGMGGSAGALGEAGAGGIALWSKRFGNGGNWACGNATAVDNAGNVVVAGDFDHTTIDFGGGPFVNTGWVDIFLAKFDSSGNHLWSKRFGDEEYDQSAAGAVFDSAGNVVVHGTFGGTVDFGGGPLTAADLGNIFVAKFDPNGNHVWSKGFGDGGHVGAGMAIDSAGNVVLAGEFSGTVDFGGGPLTAAGDYDMFVAKFDANGNHVWSKGFGDAGHDVAGPSVDSAGNVVLVGRCAAGTVDFGGGPLTNAGSAGFFLAKFDPNGNHVWSKRLGDAGDSLGAGASIDSAGNVVLVGSGKGTLDLGGGPLTTAGNEDIILAKFDPNGNHLWSKLLGGANYDYARGMAIDSAGNVVLTGDFSMPVDFGGGPLTPTDQEIFVAKFDPSGNHLSSASFGGESYQGGGALAIDSAGSMVVTGCFRRTIDFGNGPLVSTGSIGMDAFLAKLKP